MAQEVTSKRGTSSVSENKRTRNVFGPNVLFLDRMCLIFHKLHQQKWQSGRLSVDRIAEEWQSLKSLIISPLSPWSPWIPVSASRPDANCGLSPVLLHACGLEEALSYIRMGVFSIYNRALLVQMIRDVSRLDVWLTAVPHGIMKN